LIGAIRTSTWHADAVDIPAERKDGGFAKAAATRVEEIAQDADRPRGGQIADANKISPSDFSRPARLLMMCRCSSRGSTVAVAARIARITRGICRRPEERHTYL
jgi:hypothetical protein